MTSTREKAPPRRKQTVGNCPVCETTVKCSSTGLLAQHHRRSVVRDRGKIRLWMVEAGEPITNLPEQVLHEERCPGSGTQVEETWTIE